MKSNGGFSANSGDNDLFETLFLLLAVALLAVITAFR